MCSCTVYVTCTNMCTHAHTYIHTYSHVYSTKEWLREWTLQPMLFGCSVIKSGQTLCDPIYWSMPGFSVIHYLPEFAQTHVHLMSRLSDAIQSSHPLSLPSPLALNLSQHQDLFQWVGSSHQMVKVLELQLQPSVLPMNIQNWFPLGLTDFISLLSKGLSRVFSSTTVWKHQFLGTQPSLWSNFHICTYFCRYF